MTYVLWSSQLISDWIGDLFHTSVHTWRRGPCQRSLAAGVTDTNVESTIFNLLNGRIVKLLLNIYVYSHRLEMLLALITKLFAVNHG